MDAVEVALKSYAAHPKYIKEPNKFFEQCAQRLKAASNSTSEKLAALERWREDGLLGDTQAFDDLGEELLYELIAVRSCGNGLPLTVVQISMYVTPLPHKAAAAVECRVQFYIIKDPPLKTEGCLCEYVMV